MSRKTLFQIHEDVPPEHYDRAISKNFLQRYWHNKRFQILLSELIQIRKGRIIDVGCHSATFTSQIAKYLHLKNNQIAGVDISPQAIKLARKRLPKATFKVADAQNLPFANRSFDAAFCLEVLEHLDDPDSVIKDIHRVLRKNKYAYFIVPTDIVLFRLIWALWTFIYPVWRHAHVQSFTGNKLEKILIKHGFTIVKSRLFHKKMLKLVVCKKL